MQSYHNFVLAALLLAGSTTTLNADEPIRRTGGQTEQGLSAAVTVADRSLLHTSQLFPYSADETIETGNLQGQFELLLSNLDRVLQHRGASRSDVVKLNFYVASAEIANFVRARLGKSFPADALPAVSYVQTRLPYEEADVALDAIVAVEPLASDRVEHVRIDGLDARDFQSSYSVMPLGDAVYVAGQAQKGELAEATTDTLAGLLRTLRHLWLDREHIAEVKCFLDPMTEIETVDERIAAFFGDAPVPPVSHVEWIAGSLPIEIELVVFAPAKDSTDTIEIFTPPWMKSSPVFSRVTRLYGNRRIYLSGLYASKPGDGESEVRDLFASMKTILADHGSDFRHLAKATYYVSTADASSKLNQLRPEFYDPARPPSASKAMVKGVALPERGITIDMIAAPDPTDQ